MARVESPRSNRASSLAFYIHIPYCRSRCGYCDFNTYTPQELNSPDLNSLTGRYIDAAIAEINLAADTVGSAVVPSIFFGGGTPSLIPAEQIDRVIAAIRARFEFAPDIEITLEANPDSLTEEFLTSIRVSGVNRISLGMQSAVPHVLAALDRTHNPSNVATSVELIRAVGFKRCSVDLIYGAPSESLADWQMSIDAALDLPIDHISAYALIVEPGTRLAARIKRGELVPRPDDETAEKYLAFDAAASARGFEWYELSNWAKPGGSCRHNVAYWDGSFWWGVGPGAHSYFAGRRWWNVKHPSTYQSAMTSGRSPISAEEELTESNLADEFLLLNIRMRAGIERVRLSGAQEEVSARYLTSGHIDGALWSQGRLVLTPTGRLIADRIVREMLV